MSNVACPHYPEPSDQPMTRCRGCGADIANPKSAQAVGQGLVNGAGKGRTINQHNSNPTRAIK